MSDICSVCGLPKEICVCASTDKEISNIEIFLERRKYGKLWAVIKGIEHDILKDIMKKLKNRMACGGTTKKNTIEILFGKVSREKELINCLVEFGFLREGIKVVTKK